MSHSKWKHFDECIFRIQFSNLDALEDSTPFIAVDEHGGDHIISTRGTSDSSYKYNFKSIGFTQNLSKVIQEEKISHTRPTPIQSVKGTNQVSIRESRHEKFEPITKSSVNIFSFEKSLFQSVSRDMFNFMAGVKSYNNLIGEPVNKYRKNYKLLNHVRERYFSDVLNETDFERYMNYYKWIDSSIGVLLKQLVPASAFENSGIEDVIESHALERPKYEHKYSRFERKEPNLEANILAINELLYDWEHGHSEDDENQHCLWQKDRKEREDSERENIRKVLTTKTVSKTTGPGKDYVVRNLVKPYNNTVDRQRIISLGHNRQANKQKDLYKIIHTGKEIFVNSEDFYEFKKCDDLINPQQEKIYVAKTNTTDTDGYLDADADFILPFTFYSSSAGVDFDIFKTNLKITNNLDMPEAITSPSIPTGLPHRNVKIGTPAEERPEAYDIVATADTLTITQPSGPQSLFSPGLLGNRFYRTANIKTKLSDTQVLVQGNYARDYEIVLTNGRLQNNNYLVENEGQGLIESFVLSPHVVGMAEYEVPQREKREHVITNRFSAIGSPETSGKYSLDRESEEYSVYNSINNRNSITRGIYNLLSKERSEKFGYRQDSLTIGSIHKTNRNFLRTITDTGNTTTADNYFATHQIPQHDFSYAWITASANEHVDSFIQKNANTGHQHHYEISGSLKSSQTISFLTDCIAHDGSIVDFVGINKNVGRSINTSTNTLTEFIQKNISFDSETTGQVPTGWRENQFDEPKQVPGQYVRENSQDSTQKILSFSGWYDPHEDGDGLNLPAGIQADNFRWAEYVAQGFETPLRISFEYILGSENPGLSQDFGLKNKPEQEDKLYLQYKVGQRGSYNTILTIGDSGNSDSIHQSLSSDVFHTAEALVDIQRDKVYFRWVVSAARAPAADHWGIRNIIIYKTNKIKDLINSRQGPYGWPSWKQVRGLENPIVRNHRKNNIISAVFTGNTPFTMCKPGTEFEYKNTKEFTQPITNSRYIKNYKEIMATSKFNPITASRHTYRTESGIEFLYEGIPLPTQVPQWALALMWWNDEFLHEFVTKTDAITDIIQFPSVSMRVPLQNTVTGFANQTMADDFYHEERPILNTKNIEIINTFLKSQSVTAGASFLEVNYIETIYPREINTFTRHARDRQLYNFFGWDSDRENRQLVLSGNITYGDYLASFTNSFQQSIPIFALESPIKEEKEFEKSYFDSYELIDKTNTSSTNLTTSTWVLEARKDFSKLPTVLPGDDDGWLDYHNLSLSSVTTRSNLGTGLLQNEYSNYPMGGNSIRGLPAFAPTYNRRIPQETGVTKIDLGHLSDRGAAIYNIGGEESLIASDHFRYAPWKKLEDGTILQDPDSDKFALGVAIQTSLDDPILEAYLFLSSEDMYNKSLKKAPASMGGPANCAAPDWIPHAWRAGAFPRPNSTSSSPESIEIQDGIEDSISQIEELDIEAGDKLYLSFTELELDPEVPEDWTVTSAGNKFQEGNLALMGSMTADSWITSTNRVETRIYRSGSAFIYKWNPTTLSGYQLLGQYTVPSLSLEIDWDIVLQNGLTVTTDDDQPNFIRAEAELVLVEDNTSKQTVTPDIFSTIHVQFSSSTAIPAGSVLINRGVTHCDEIAKPYAFYYTEFPASGSVNNIRLSNPVRTNTVSGSVLAGEAMWEAADGTEVGPFYDEYKHFAEETRVVGQQYSLIPEFTMSRYIEDIYASGSLNNVSIGDNFLHLNGAVYDSSTGDVSIGTQFFKTYSNSDFMKYFQPFKDNITENGFDLTTGKLTLRCSAVKRLLPYRGFYPAERAVQISEIFHRNYLNDSTYEAEYVPNSFLSEEQALDSLKIKINNLKSQAAKPLFGPGVLFNSIKSGLAVDYPLFTGDISKIKDNLIDGKEDSWIPPHKIFLDQNIEPSSFDLHPTLVNFDLDHGVRDEDYLHSINEVPFIGPIYPPSLLPNGDVGIPRLTGIVNRRIQFEDLLQPVRLFGQTLFENEPHESASTLYGNRLIYMVKEDQPRFGVLDKTAALENNTIVFRQNILNTVSSMKPYTSAIHNFTAETVKFFLKDGKLQTVVSRPAKPRLTQGVNYMMKVFMNNKGTVMYDRHSAFGPPVDDNSPIMERYVSSNIPSVPASGSIQINDDVFDTINETVTIENTSGDSKRFIIKDDIPGATSSAEVVFQAKHDVETQVDVGPGVHDFVYEYDCVYDNNEELGFDGDIVQAIDHEKAFIAATGNSSKNGYRTKSLTIPAGDEKVEINYYNSQCYKGSRVQITFNDPDKWSSEVKDEMKIIDKEHVSIVTDSAGQIITAIPGAGLSSATDTVPSFTQKVGIFCVIGRENYWNEHFNSYVTKDNGDKTIPYSEFPHVLFGFWDSDKSNAEASQRLADMLNNFNADPSGLSQSGESVSAWVNADGLYFRGPDGGSATGTSGFYRSELIPCGIPMIDVWEGTRYKTPQELATQVQNLITEKENRLWLKVTVTSNGAICQVPNADKDSYTLRARHTTAGTNQANAPGVVGIFPQYPTYAWESNRVCVVENLASWLIAASFSIATVPGCPSISNGLLPDTYLQLNHFTVDNIIDTDKFAQVSKKTDLNSAGAEEIDLSALSDGTSLADAIANDEASSTTAVNNQTSNIHVRFIDLNDAGYKAKNPALGDNTVEYDDRPGGFQQGSLSCLSKNVINTLESERPKFTLRAECEHPSTDVADFTNSMAEDKLIVERTVKADDTQLLIDKSGRLIVKKWFSSFSHSMSGGQNQVTFTNAQMLNGDVVIKVGKDDNGSNSIPLTLANAALAIGDETNGFNHPTGMIVSHNAGETTLHLTQSVHGTIGNKSIVANKIEELSDQISDDIITEGFSGGVDFSAEPYLRKEEFVKFDAHGYLPYVPPYLDPETAPYAHISFTPSQTREYTIPEIIDGMSVSYFNMPPPNDAEDNDNYTNAMNLEASISFNNSVSLYTDNYTHLGSNSGKQSIVPNSDQPLHRWVIQPKWETPIMNFKDSEVSTLNLDTMEVVKTSGSVWKTRYQTDYYTELPSSEIPYLTASTGMWHQRGIPTVDTDDGYYLTVVGPGRDVASKTSTGDLAAAVGFTEPVFDSYTPRTPTIHLPEISEETLAQPDEANPFQSVKLGQLADEKVISEAVVAIPYYLDDDCDMKFFEMRPDIYQAAIQKNVTAREEFVEYMRRAHSEQEVQNIKDEYERFFESVGLESVDSAAYQMRMMDKYIMPPQFDFNRNFSIKPYVAYIFQFKATLSKQDLADIWQNLYPTSKTGISVAQHSNIAIDNTKSDVEYITHVIGNSTAPFLKGKISMYNEPDKFLDNNIRWLIFKIKYRAETHYSNIVENSITQYPENIMEMSKIKKFDKNNEFERDLNDKLSFSKFGYNWPYDYFSMIELIKVESKVDFLSSAQRVADTIPEVPEIDTSVVDLDNDSGVSQIQTLTTNVLNKIVSRQVIKKISDPLPVSSGVFDIPLELGETIRPNSESLYLNGQLLVSGAEADYTISGGRVTFTSALDVNDNIQISYIKE